MAQACPRSRSPCPRTHTGRSSAIRRPCDDDTVDGVDIKEFNPWSEVKHKIRVPNLTNPEDGLALEQALAEVDGVLRVSVDSSKRWVQVDYLQTKTDYQSLEQVVETAGFARAVRRW